jgi:hypothetical protein
MFFNKFEGMNSMRIDILNPKAEKLLKDLEDLDLIAIRESNENAFLNIVNKIREKAKTSSPSLEEITKEVEAVRSKRYAKKG